ncbi:[FeFe] hydrogenase, group A [Geobacter hydrogenophilus]|uniref:NADPH-Fe(3+) oxidoreductase subunit alpha n=1 Tax=Geobacter hydrogenophilus TaxID=40983 RepID=A0A9W6LDM4_9BACT|nr:NADH-dependent [FeFe] hydrogenase, group A6 [Geobacter hydrogenophilus]MBT0893041.1 [FeFe] hydrogenase, group A [Geobacter hydrogenophilus]GLI39120.1 NADH:ubiquinone oxidoreductase [Geobacter hydrogenophilus]
MTTVNITIDNKVTAVPPGTTILEAAQGLGIGIPTLCHLDLHTMEVKNQPASCRVCVVEVEGRRNLAPACATPVAEGMVVKSHSPRVLVARKAVLELLLSDHPRDCLVCAKSGQCGLQDLAEKFGLREVRFQGTISTYPKDHSPAIVRDMDKCIMCRRCETMCNQVQGCKVLTGVNRGFDSVVAPPYDLPLGETVCTNCGQCVAVCPVGALMEKDQTAEVLAALADPEKVVVVQTAPAVRAALGEPFGMEPGTLVTGKMVSALRELGFDHVFDTNFTADLTIMEEGSELLDRLNRHLAGDESVKLPILTSCCPAWVKFFEHQFPDLLHLPSTAKSPQQMFGAVAKSFFAETIGIPREKMVVVSIMPCLAKKFEAARPEFAVGGNPDVDYVLSTRELARMIRGANIDFATLADGEFDQPLGESTGAAVIFGATGGVLEAAVRTACEVATGRELPRIDFQELRGVEGVRSATVKVGEVELKVGVVHKLGNARTLMERIRAGEEEFHAIEVMSCPGGCIGGGGQPYHQGREELLEMRTAALYRDDCGKPLRKSHENPHIQELYRTFLGEPLGEKAHELLHTHYQARPGL